MRSPHRAVGLALASATALALGAAAPASAAPSTTWELRDIGQRTCVTSAFGHPGTYFFVPLFGDWSTTITTGTRNLPPGSSSVGSAPIPPGSNHGNTIIALIGVSIAPAPVGVYTAEVWASDGTTTKAVPVKITVQERC